MQLTAGEQLVGGQFIRSCVRAELIFGPMAQEKTFCRADFGDSRAPAIRPARTPGSDGLGDQRNAATAQLTGEFNCGSDWLVTAACGFGEVSAKWSMMAGRKDVMS